MKAKKLVSIKDSIATQLLKIVFSFYFILTILVTMTHLSVEFFNNQEELEHELELIGKAFSPGVSDAMWKVDPEQLDLILSGILQFPSIVGIEIREEFSDIKFQKGITNSSQTENYTSLFHYSIPLFHQHSNRTVGLGKIYLYSSSNIVFSKMKVSLVFILINSIIKTTALWFLFLFTAQKLLTQPLSKLTQIAEKLSLDQLDNLKISIVTKGRNELKVLEEAFQSMIQKLIFSREELKEQYSQLQQTQAQLVHTEKVAGLGQLIAGIAHEINTPAAAIKGAVHEMERGYGVLSQLTIYLSKNLPLPMQEHYFRITSKVLAFSPQELSTKEQRKKAKTLQEQLEIQQVENSRSISRDLVLIGFEAEQMEEIAPLYLTQQSQEVHQALQQLGMEQIRIKNIKLSINRIVRLIKALKNYLHPDSAQLAESNLQEDLENTLAILQHQLKQGITIHREFEEIPLVRCYANQLNQVWTNLIHNAIQALKGKGEIFLRLKSWNQDQIAIEVEDLGPGIPEELQEKIFFPYFTTKPRGEGTGLGLTICQQIIQKHKGSFTVESQPGKTRFRVILPISQKGEITD